MGSRPRREYRSVPRHLSPARRTGRNGTSRSVADAGPLATSGPCVRPEGRRWRPAGFTPARPPFVSGEKQPGFLPSGTIGPYGVDRRSQGRLVDLRTRDSGSKAAPVPLPVHSSDRRCLLQPAASWLRSLWDDEGLKGHVSLAAQTDGRPDGGLSAPSRPRRIRGRPACREAGDTEQ